jgi:hypothetical protein
MRANFEVLRNLPCDIHLHMTIPKGLLVDSHPNNNAPNIHSPQISVSRNEKCKLLCSKANER